MPREDRRITFSHEEVYKAIFALCVQRELKKPPPGVIRAIELSSDGSRVSITLDNPQVSAPIMIIEYSLDFLAAALMLYCRTCRIPLPKTAGKSVEVAQDTVVLRVQINQLTM